MTEPTDAEIWQMWMPMVRRMGVADPVEFARAVLAKWGTPAPVGVEPVANLTVQEGKIAFAAIILPDGLYDLYTTPQPTQMQAVAVPLTDEQIDQAIAELGLNYLADAHATNRAVLRKLCHHAHGIKGGKHGADT